jgi:hypothetical protein
MLREFLLLRTGIESNLSCWSHLESVCWTWKTIDDYWCNKIAGSALFCAAPYSWAEQEQRIGLSS